MPPPRSFEGGGGGGGGDADGCKLYVGNLSFQTQSADMREYFAGVCHQSSFLARASLVCGAVRSTHCCTAVFPGFRIGDVVRYLTSPAMV